MSNDSIVVCGFCGNICEKYQVVVLKEGKLYHADKAKCNHCNKSFFELGDLICGKESPDKFNYYLSVAIDLNK